MTEDMIQEQQEVLANLGTSEEAAKVRAKMQSSSLLSDMQAFKVLFRGHGSQFKGHSSEVVLVYCRLPILVLSWRTL